MRSRNQFYICLFLLMATQLCEAQPVTRYNTFHYSVNEGLLQSTMSDIAFDKNNFCWLSFPNGIQKFDGKNFITVPVQPGLQDDKFALFFQKKNEDLLISHSQGISLYDISTNKFRQVYKNNPAIRNPPVFIGENENAIYFFTGRNMVALDSRTHDVLREFINILPQSNLNIETRPKVSDNIINNRVGIIFESVAYLLDLKTGSIIGDTKNMNEKILPYFIRMISGEEILYYTYDNTQGFWQYNFQTKTKTLHSIGGKDKRPLSRCHFLKWQNNPVITINEHVYETDSNITKLGSEIVNYQNESVSGSGIIWRAKEDKLGNLYLMTVTSGFVKLIRNNYQLKYYGTQPREHNNVISVLPDKKNNRILMGCVNRGLLVFDTLQQLIAHIKFLPGGNEPLSVNAIVPDGKNGYFILAVSGRKIWHLSEDLSTVTILPVQWADLPQNAYADYFAHTLYRDPKRAIIQSQGKIFAIDIEKGKATQYTFTNSYTMGGLLHNRSFISHTNDELLFLDTDSFSVQKRIVFKNTGYVRCIIREAEGHYFLGTNNGIFKIDSTGKILARWTKQDGLPDDCIYAMAIDKEGALWCSTNKGLFKLRDGKILQLKKEDGLQENEFNTNVVASTEDGELFFGGVNGVSSFYPDRIENRQEKIHLMFTEIKVNNKTIATDTAAWNINRIVLPYTRSSLSFDFIAIANSNPDQYIYQYQMSGFDKDWIQNDGMQTVRYALPPGRYVFRIYASRFFDNTALPMQEIVIIIRPPFWKTSLFNSLLFAALIGSVLIAINARSRRKYRKKLRILESEHKIKLERERISRDLHDNLGAYANAVLFNTEMLEQDTNEKKKQELINNLKFASKDIITSLRETIWALNQESYSAQDCLLRIRNFIQPFLRYYPHIRFVIEGDAPPELMLQNTRALNLVRIVQEAISNSIKHASPSSIHIRNFTEPGTWQLKIDDDGKGFNFQKQLDLASGNGLKNMQHRAEDGAFQFTIDTAEGKGTTITITVHY